MDDEEMAKEINDKAWDSASSEDSKEAQQRIEPRIREEKVIEIKVVKDRNGIAVDSPEFIMRVAKEYSSSGLRFEIAKPLQIGEQLQVKVALESSEDTALLIGRVCWAEQLSDEMPCSIGVLFVPAESPDFEAWVKYVDKSLEDIRRNAYGL